MTATGAIAERLRILDALVMVIERKHELLPLLRGSPEESGRAIAEHFGLDDIQAHAVLNLQLYRLGDESLSRLKGEREHHQAQLP